MKIELELSQQDIDRIAQKVCDLLTSYFSQALNSNTEELLTVEQVSKLLGKSKDQIYQWVNNAQHGLSDFPFQKAGKSLRFSKSEILRWTKGHGNS